MKACKKRGSQWKMEGDIWYCVIKNIRKKPILQYTDGECNYLQVLNENGQKRAEMFDGDLFGII